MEDAYTLIIVFAIHAVFCAVWFKFAKIPLKDAAVLAPMVLCLPIIGLICAMISTRDVNRKLETPVSKLYRRVENEALSVSTRQGELETVVPFDEILLLSNDKSRREVMMHILRRDPFQYLEMLKAAKVSSDVEITHYATATIMEIQRDLDIAMQSAEEAYRAAPEDLETVNRFILSLISYIKSGLLPENRLIQLRHQLSDILRNKLRIFSNSRNAHLQLVENEISLGNYERAAMIAANMRKKWPMDEASWLSSLRVCMASGDAEEKADIAEKLKSMLINWSRAGREELEFLCGT